MSVPSPSSGIQTYAFNVSAHFPDGWVEGALLGKTLYPVPGKGDLMVAAYGGFRRTDTNEVDLLIYGNVTYPKGQATSDFWWGSGEPGILLVWRAGTV